MIIFAKGWSVGRDGPGQRLIYYLKGCNMSCLWCASPESISTHTEMLFYPQRSSTPVDHVCPHHAIAGEHLDRRKCWACQGRDCVNTWKCNCFELAGQVIALDEIVQAAVDARTLFGDDGGVTFGGGEPTLQIDQLCTCLEKLRNERIHTAIESNAATREFRRIVGLVDYLICDFKADDAGLHRRFTGVDNRQVKENLDYAAANQQDLHVRIPLVTGLNDQEEEMVNIATFLTELDLQHVNAFGEGLVVEVIPLHHLGEAKYQALGREYPMAGIVVPTKETVMKFKEILMAHKLRTIET